MSSGFLWILWAIGVLVPFALKLGHHLWKTSPEGVSFGRALRDFVFADTEASIKTFINITASMLIGAIYIDDLTLPFLPEVDVFPQRKHGAVALFLASFCELVVPYALNLATDAVKSRIKKKLEK